MSRVRIAGFCGKGVRTIIRRSLGRQSLKNKKPSIAFHAVDAGVMVRLIRFQGMKDFLLPWRSEQKKLVKSPAINAV